MREEPKKREVEAPTDGVMTRGLGSGATLERSRHIRYARALSGSHFFFFDATQITVPEFNLN
jgi:hypothetical protein